MTVRFTNRQKMQCAQREVSQRMWVYKNRVSAGKMTQAAADTEIALMQEIALDYGALAKADDEKGRLI